jgi:hypothetical protein
MAVMLWCDHEGHPIEPNQDMIDRLKFQIHARQTKNISPEQVIYEIEQQMLSVEKQQQKRWDEAVDQMAEDLKRDKEKIFTAATRECKGLPSIVKPKNILTLKIGDLYAGSINSLSTGSSPSPHRHRRFRDSSAKSRRSASRKIRTHIDMRTCPAHGSRNPNRY